MDLDAPVRRLPNGWNWVRTDQDHRELDRDGGPVLAADRIEEEHTRWRLTSHVERDETTTIDDLAVVPNCADADETLIDIARCIERYDLPDEHLGRLLRVEGTTVRQRDWRIE